MKSPPLRIKHPWLYLFGLMLSVIPPLAAILCYFPVWIAKGGEFVVSGLAVLLCIPAVAPIGRMLARRLRSPAGYTMWLVMFVIFFALSRIAEQMTVISLIGFISNLIGACIFKLASSVKEK